ncbi:MAG: glycine cleavage T C-terminal barrel domain-containing protein [Nitratireductor sp.]
MNWGSTGWCSSTNRISTANGLWRNCRTGKPARKLVSIEIDGDKAAHNALVYHRKKREVGMVTSALWSPTCKRNIAFAWLEAPFGEDVVDDLWVGNLSAKIAVATPHGALQDR